MINNILKNHRNKIVAAIEEEEYRHKKAMKEFNYKLKILDMNIIHEYKNLNTTILKLYLVLGSVDAAKIINELGYRVKTSKVKSSNGERKYKPKDITKIIDEFKVRDKSIEKGLVKKAKEQRVLNLKGKYE